MDNPQSRNEPTHNSEKCCKPYCKDCFANIKRIADEGRSQLKDALTPSNSGTPDTDEQTSLMAIIHKHFQINGALIKAYEPYQAYDDILAWHKAALHSAEVAAMQKLATELKRYDWQLEDSINANDVVTDQIDATLEELSNNG